MDFTPDDILKGKAPDFKNMKFPAVGVIVLFVLVVGAFTSVFSIGADEVGVVTRFGKYVREAGPGLHVKLPFLIEHHVPVKVTRIFKEEFGFRENVSSRSRSGGSNFQSESIMLTGDLNVLEVNWIVQFQISDPVKFLFKVRNQREAIRDMAEAAMRRLVGDYSVDEVLTRKRVEIDHEVQKELQEILNSYDAGIEIVTVKLQDVTPSDRVKPAFNEVNEAKQEKERVINQAWEAYNKVIPQAKGEAEKTVSFAEGYALSVVNLAKGEAGRFDSVRVAYEKAPEVTRKRLYLDSMEKVLPRVQQKYIVDESSNSVLPLLQLQGGNALQAGGKQ